ncbi:hypothetical protein HUU62_15285 [Rhodoferax sp. 4810]|nr:hypothetical protein [Rhodoferax jenense]
MVSEFPATIDAAVRLLKTMVDVDEQAKTARMDEAELFHLHFGLGAWIRNNLGLYAGNDQLMRATEMTEPDDASMVVIRSFWVELRAGLPRMH